jgi:hypothetical protein
MKCSVPLIRKLVSDQACILEGLFHFTKLSKFDISRCTYHSGLSSMHCFGRSTPLPPSYCFRPCRGPTMRPAYALTLHCCLSTLQAAALRLCLAAWDFERTEDHFLWYFNHEDILTQTG